MTKTLKLSIFEAQYLEKLIQIGIQQVRITHVRDDEFESLEAVAYEVKRQLNSQR